LLLGGEGAFPILILCSVRFKYLIRLEQQYCCYIGDEYKELTDAPNKQELLL